MPGTRSMDRGILPWRVSHDIIRPRRGDLFIITPHGWNGRRLANRVVQRWTRARRRLVLADEKRQKFKNSAGQVKKGSRNTKPVVRAPKTTRDIQQRDIGGYGTLVRSRCIRHTACSVPFNTFLPSTLLLLNMRCNNTGQEPF
jgi:hypothetical protein